MIAAILFWARNRIVQWVGYALLGLTVVLSIRQAGKNAERLSNMKKTVKAVEVKNEIRNRNRASDAAKRLRDKWQRD